MSVHGVGGEAGGDTTDLALAEPTLNRSPSDRVEVAVPKPETTLSPASTAPVRAPANRVVQGLLFTGGGVLLALTAGEDRISFYWTPLILGITYLVAAIVDGRRGGYWATGLGLTGWGLAVVYVGDVRPQDIDPAGAYLAGVGLAGIAAAVLRSRGFLISEVGFAATVAAAGLTLAFTPRAPESLEDATTYAIALGLVGLLNMAGGGYQLARGGSRARPGT